MSDEELGAVTQICLDLHGRIEVGGTGPMRTACAASLHAVGREIARRAVKAGAFVPDNDD